MMNSPQVTMGLVILGAVLFYVLAWWAVRGASTDFRIATRIVTAAVPIFAVLWFLPAQLSVKREVKEAAPHSRQSDRPSDREPSAPKEIPDEEEEQKPEEVEDTPEEAIDEPDPQQPPETEPPENSADDSAADESASESEIAAPDPGSVRPKLPASGSGGSAAMREPHARQPAGGSTPRNAARPAPKFAPSPQAAGAGKSPDTIFEESADWNVVPVFYGTDRDRKDAGDRISYDWQRGRRLEMGRALITIPKDHTVPMVERPWAIRVPYIDVTLYEAAEDPKKHFTIKELKALTREEFLAHVRDRLKASERYEDHALIFVHGYKTTFENALYRTAQISYDLKFDGAPFLYSWPSGGTLQGYTYDRESAGQAEPYFREFLETVVSDTGARKVSIVAHSMGNQLLLRVLQDLKRSLPEGVLVSQLILAAPDVDRHSFENIIRSIQGIAEGITLYSASNDQALLMSRRVNGGIPRAGDVPDDGPIIMEGMDTIDATASSMDSIGINHSGYAENNALLADISMLISSGLRPPEKRLPTLQSVLTDRGTYWRYPASAAGVAGHGK